MTEQSLFYVLKSEYLTTLKISYNWRNKSVQCFAAREWDNSVNWSKYNKKFSWEDFLTDRPVYLGSEETIALFKKHNLSSYLNQVIELIKKGNHMGIECFYDDRKDIRFINNMHSNLFGINNRKHAIRTGGIRRHGLDHDELDIIIDGLNLSRAMSYKNYAAFVPYGGSKITVHANPIELDDYDSLGFLAYAIDRTKSYTGPDMGFTPQFADVLKKNFTSNIGGGIEGIGPSGMPTAYGVYLALKEICKFKYGSASLKDRTIAVQGLGAVGFPMAEHCLKDEAKLIVADMDESNVKKLFEKFPIEKGNNIKVVKCEEIVGVDAEIFSPCAIGGIIGEEMLNHLKFKIIIGGANNVIKASSKEEEIYMAKQMDTKGIYHQVEWIHNIGGVLAGLEEYERQDEASLENVLLHIEKNCPKYVNDILQGSEKLGITPTEYAYQSVEKVLYK